MIVNKDLTAAAAVPLVLKILLQGESYGYEIIRTVKTLSGNKWEWAEGMLYPVLHRLEKQSWAEAVWQKAPNGRKRKYYRITEKGKEALADLDRQWDFINHIQKQAKRMEGEYGE